jgi:hypothetical protein
MTRGSFPQSAARSGDDDDLIFDTFCHSFPLPKFSLSCPFRLADGCPEVGRAPAERAQSHFMSTENRMDPYHFLSHTILLDLLRILLETDSSWRATFESSSSLSAANHQALE